VPPGILTSTLVRLKLTGPRLLLGLPHGPLLLALVLEGGESLVKHHRPLRKRVRLVPSALRQAKDGHPEDVVAGVDLRLDVQKWVRVVAARAHVAQLGCLLVLH